MKNPPDNQNNWQHAEPAVEQEMEPALAQPRKPAGLATHLPLWKMVLVLAWWPLLEQMLGALVWFVDSSLTGHLPDGIVGPASDAIGASTFILWLMGILQGSVGIGATAIVARSIGANNKRDAELALGQSMLIAVVWGTFNGIIFFILADRIGPILNLSTHANELCAMYLRILAVVAPFRAILIIGGAALRGAGDTKSPFFVMLLVNILNLILSITMVQVYSMGLQGIAIGTSISWTVGGIVMIYLLIRGRGGIKLHQPDIRPHKIMLTRLGRVSGPALLENIGHWMPSFIMLYLVGYLVKINMGENLIGSHNIAIRIEGFSFLPGFAFSIAASTLAGQYLGANDPQGAKKAVAWAMLYGVSLMVLCGLVLIIFPDKLTLLATDKEPFITDTPPLLRIVGFAQLGFATAMILGGALRGAGDTTVTMTITYFSNFVIRLPLAWFLSIHLEMGLNGIWLAMSIELTIRGCIVLARFLHGGWTKIKV